MSKLKKNTELTKFIKYCNEKIPTIRTKKELERLLDECVAFPYQFSYNLIPYWAVLVVALLFVFPYFKNSLILISLFAVSFAPMVGARRIIKKYTIKKGKKGTSIIGRLIINLGAIPLVIVSAFISVIIYLIGIWMLNKWGDRFWSFPFLYASQQDFINGSALLLVIIIDIILLRKRLKAVNVLSDNIKEKAMRILYNTRKMSETELDNCCSKFKDFKRYSTANNITTGTELDFHTPDGKIRVKVVTYQGIEEVCTTEGVFRHEFYRQGVIFPAQRFRSMIVSADFPSDGKVPIKFHRETFVPSSITFKKKFTVQGASEFKMAKFLIPDIVEQIEKAEEQLKGLTIEFNANGNMLICQEDTKLLDVGDSEYSLSNPQKFKEELLTQSTTKLGYIFGFAIKLMNNTKIK